MHIAVYVPAAEAAPVFTLPGDTLNALLAAVEEPPLLSTAPLYTFTM